MFLLLPRAWKLDFAGGECYLKFFGARFGIDNLIDRVKRRKGRLFIRNTPRSLVIMRLQHTILFVWPFGSSIRDCC